MPDGRIIEYFVQPDGTVQFVHSDRAAALAAALPGEKTVVRASRVDPDGGVWRADLRAVGGPVLGPFPIDARDAAVAAEVAWLHARLEKGELHVDALIAGANASPRDRPR